MVAKAVTRHSNAHDRLFVLSMLLSNRRNQIPLILNDAVVLQETVVCHRQMQHF